MTASTETLFRECNRRLLLMHQFVTTRIHRERFFLVWAFKGYEIIMRDKTQLCIVIAIVAIATNLRHAKCECDFAFLDFPILDFGQNL
jgi:hypothetical protein